jgi:hypothetical protein
MSLRTTADPMNPAPPVTMNIFDIQLKPRDEDKTHRIADARQRHQPISDGSDATPWRISEEL